MTGSFADLLEDFTLYQDNHQGDLFTKKKGRLYNIKNEAHSRYKLAEKISPRLEASPLQLVAMAFDGTWKVEKSENYEKFMEAMGINLVKRKIGAHDNLKITIQQEGNKFTIKESSNFRTIEIVFTLGEIFDYSLADGTELQGNWDLKEGKLVGTFKRKDNGKDLLALREIVGDEMVQTYTYEGVIAKRIFKKA